MAVSHSDQLKQLDELLSANNQSWLLGAGISFSACLPLMGALTTRVLAIASEKKHKHENVLTEARSHLPSDSTIEHVLSHFADYLAIADRTRAKEVTIGKITVKCDDLRELLNAALSWIAETIRWGFVEAKPPDTARVGSRDAPIVTIDGHQAFISAIFNRGQAGIAERRAPVRFFTTNYDTLLEDALSLCCVPHWDGYTGGAVAFRSFHFGNSEPDSGYRAHVIKLHGSIDWHIDDQHRIFRVRDNDIFPKRDGRVLIYPQASKYLATQRDPFAGQFELFRRALLSQAENVLVMCGYSCGDEHINQEIELALQRPDNKTTLIIFTPSISPIHQSWQNKSWAKRLYLVTGDGLFVGKGGPFAPPASGNKHSWWTFGGVTDVLVKGSEACVS